MDAGPLRGAEGADRLEPGARGCRPTSPMRVWMSTHASINRPLCGGHWRAIRGHLRNMQEPAPTDSGHAISEGMGC